MGKEEEAERSDSTEEGAGAEEIEREPLIVPDMEGRVYWPASSKVTASRICIRASGRTDAQMVKGSSFSRNFRTEKGIFITGPSAGALIKAVPFCTALPTLSL